MVNQHMLDFFFFGTRDSIQRYFVDFRIDLFEIPGISISDAKSKIYISTSRARKIFGIIISYFWANNYENK